MNGPPYEEVEEMVEKESMWYKLRDVGLLARV